jgi:hypothetical protein
MVIRMAEKEDKTLEVKLKKVKDEIAKHQKEAEKDEKLKFVGLTDKELWRKLSKAETPFIFGTSISPWSVSQGGSLNYWLYIHNPDAGSRRMHVYSFVGPANFVEVKGRALLTVDTRFPRLIGPNPDGLYLQPHHSSYVGVQLDIPQNVEPSCYMVNAFLFNFRHYETGSLYDRASYIFEVNGL